MTPNVDHEYHTRQDPHGGGARLGDIILGGQDGLVNVLGVILGVVAATGDRRVVIAAGLAAAFAESISMAAVAYTSLRAAGDRYDSEREREYRHVRRVPALERDEVRAIYAGRGLRGELLDRVVEAITADPDVWVAVMMAEEHQLAPVDGLRALRSALVVGTASLVGSLVPLVPFFFAPSAMRASTGLAVALAAVVLFALGAYKARVTVGHPLKSGLALALIGTLSALAGYGIGALFKVPGLS